MQKSGKKITSCINDGYKQIHKHDVSEEENPHTSTNNLFVVLLQMWINTV